MYNETEKAKREGLKMMQSGADERILDITPELRLRRYAGECDFALEWYSDPELVFLVDGVREPYTSEKLHRMYDYLNVHGELYFIEAKENGEFRPVGDVTFSVQDMPIVIGEAEYRGRGIGRAVVSFLAARAKRNGISELFVQEIYSWNICSKRCFESVGFVPYKPTEKGFSYRLELRGSLNRKGFCRNRNMPKQGEQMQTKPFRQTFGGRVICRARCRKRKVNRCVRRQSV
jgi:histone acetyltransferase HPA2, putative